MRSLYLGIFLSVICLCVNAQTDTAAYRLLGKEIQKKYAPDKRAIYFNMQIKGDSVKLESTSQEALNEFEKLKPNNANIKYNALLLPNKSLNNLEYGVCNLSVSNNRANPQNAAELMTQMLLGTPVRILKKQGGFYLVKTPDGYLSWTDGSAIKPMNLQQYKAWQNYDKVVFTADYGHAFTGPRFNGVRVSDLVSGNILQLLAKAKCLVKWVIPMGE